MNIEWFLNMLLRDLANLWEQVIQGLMPVTGYFDWILAARLVLTLILCGLIGLERSGHESATGFRPHILVGLGACLMTMAGIYALPESSSMRDPMRVASYVVSGIGFLGAGAILRHGAIVQGVTTAASIWGCAGIGIAVGAGLGMQAIFFTMLVLFTLVVLEWVEERLTQRGREKYLNIHLKDANRAVGKVLTALSRLGVKVKKANVVPAEGETSLLMVELTQPMKAPAMANLVKQLLFLKSILHVDVGYLTNEQLRQMVLEQDSIKDDEKSDTDKLEQETKALFEDLNLGDEEQDFHP